MSSDHDLGILRSSPTTGSELCWDSLPLPLPNPPLARSLKLVHPLKKEEVVQFPKKTTGAYETIEKHQKLRKPTQLRNPLLLGEEFLLPRGRGRGHTRWDPPRFFSANREDWQGPRAPQGRAAATAPTAPRAPRARRNPAGLTRGAGSLDHMVPNVLPVISLWVGRTWDPPGSKCRRHSARADGEWRAHL